MAKTLDERLEELYNRRDNVGQQFNADDIKTFVEGIRDAREKAGTPIKGATATELQPDETPTAEMTSDGTLVLGIPKGQKGDDGKHGDPGEQGKSAYQVWLEEGNEGTEADFFNSLKAHVSRFIPIATEAGATSLDVGDTYAFSDVPSPTDGAMLLMPNGDTTTPKTLMFSVTSNGDTPETFTYTYVGELSISTEGFLSSDKIVQNLNTGGADKVPSAAAVKVLDESIFGVITMVEGEELSLDMSTGAAKHKKFNPNATETQNIIVETGTAGVNTVWIVSSEFAAVKNSYGKIRVYANDDRDSYLMFTKAVIPNEDATFQDLVDGNILCDGATWENRFVVIHSNTYKDIDIPIDAVYCYVSIKVTINGYGRTPQKIVPVSEIRVGGSINELREEIDDKTEGLVVKVKEAKGRNLCNPDEIVDGFINGTNGNVGSSTSYRATGYIPIDEEGLTCELSYTGGTSIGYYYYNVDKGKIEGFYPGHTISGSTKTFAACIDGAKYVRFTIGDKTSNVMVSKGTRIWSYEPYEGEHDVISPDMLPKQQSDKLEMLLPDRFYHVAGDTLQLFYRGMVRCVNLNDKYVNPSCTIGLSYCRMFETISSSVGTYPLTLDVYDDNRNKIASGVTSIQVVQSPVNPSDKKHVLLLGGSFIENNTIKDELTRRLTGQAGTGEPNAIGLTNLTIHRIGHEGWGWYDYTHNNRTNPTNPFWVNGQLDVSAWADNIASSQEWGEGEKMDIIYAIFAYNGLYSNSVDDFKNYIESFINTLPNGCTLILVAPVLPNVQLSKMTADTAGVQESDAYRRYCKVWEIYKMYKEVAAENENVEFESWCGQFDMEYGYPLTTPHAVNIRKTDVTIPVVSNTIHPSDSVGYLQLADAAYRSVVAHLCQPSE